MKKNYPGALETNEALNRMIASGTALAESDQWREMCESIEDPHLKSFTAIMLDEQKKYMDSLDEATYTTNIGSWDKFAFPIIRTVFPNLVANNLVSVQPMQGPTGLVFFMRYIFGSNKGRVVQGTEAFVNIDSSYSSENVPDEILGTGDGTEDQYIVTLGYSPVRPSTVQIMTVASGATLIVTDDGNGNLIGDVNGGGVNTINYLTGDIDVTFSNNVDNGEVVKCTYDYNSEGNENIPEMELQLSSDSVAAEVRKIKTKWSMEAMQRLRAIHGEDGETELTTVLTNEMRAETDRMIIEDLWEMGDTWPIPPVADRFSIVPREGVSTQEHYNSFVAHLNRDAMAMFNLTKRAMPNWIVCGTEVGAIISSITGFDAADPGGTMGILPLGRLRQKWDVYVDPNMNSTYYLMGWKGPSWLEAGYAYMPWIALYTTPTVLLDDFTGRKGFASQAGKKMIEKRYYKRSAIKLTK
jgi:hypothetical protein